MESSRYLEADKVTLPARAPLFVEEGRCQWCNKKLHGRAKLYCQITEEEKKGGWRASPCAEQFLYWWCSRPAYVRATLIKDNFTCQKCGLHPMREDKPWLPDISQLECDHIIPVAKGGETTMDNLQTLCRACNRKKGTTVPAGHQGKPRRKDPSKPLLPLPDTFVRQRITPLCGWPWLEEHLYKEYPEQGMEVLHDGKVLCPLTAEPKRGLLKAVMKMAASLDRRAAGGKNCKNLVDIPDKLC